MDINRQLEIIKNSTSIASILMFVLILLTAVIAIYQKKKGGNYKRTVIVGIAVVFLIFVVMSFVLNSLVEPIYNLKSTY